MNHYVIVPLRPTTAQNAEDALVVAEADGNRVCLNPTCRKPLPPRHGNRKYCSRDCHAADAGRRSCRS